MTDVIRTADTGVGEGSDATKSDAEPVRRPDSLPEDEHTHPSPAHRDACPVCNPDKTVPELSAAYAQRTSNSKVYEDGELWSFIRRCMSQGKDIHLDHAQRTYEKYSARLDLAALERLPELQAYIVRAVVSARGSSETPTTRHLHCIGYSPTLSGFGVREGGPEGELIATFKRQADADEYIRRNAHETEAPLPAHKMELWK
jgi:hypothetical protein